MRSEFAFLESLRKNFALEKIGDDCAVLPMSAKTDLVITSDMLVEDIDFRLDWTRADFLGHKALAVSLSDIAAMGAKPQSAMLSIGITDKIWRTKFIDDFYKGFLKLAKKFDVELIGGDVSRTPDKIVIDSILLGETKKGKAILRSGAKAGDLIFVTGSLGGAAAGLKLLEEGKRFEKGSKDPVQKLLERQLEPNPQTEIGQILGEKNLATAMIDISDGLSSDLAHLCRASGVGACIFAEKIPVDKNLKKLFPDALDYALNGGEDFELLFAANPKDLSKLESALKAFPFRCIGEATTNSETIELAAKDKTTILKPKGFRHF